MTTLHFGFRLGPHLDGDVQAVCPHCQQGVTLRRHRLEASAHGIPVNTDVFVCSRCEEVSRIEPRWKRVVGVIFLIPFLGLFTIGFGAGVYFLFRMFSGEYEWGVMAAGFMLVFGFLGHRVGRFAWRLWRQDGPIAMKHLQTSM